MTVASKSALRSSLGSIAMVKVKRSRILPAGFVATQKKNDVPVTLDDKFRCSGDATRQNRIFR
ncbi:hypothetical protein [Burkholderia multivorans]|uniref:hypothetical protein n=1 Tax=Burkholderia multivorans TaxID=87883 RepID=UPI000F4F23D8|nr:hypothetical protein [Burkholderia multivorans]